MAAVLFDLDGVLTPTSDLHRAAWRAVLGAFLADAGVRPYDEDDYFRHVDGLPRYDGVRAVLASRGLRLPEGSPDDPPGSATVCALGNRKDAQFAELLERDGIAPYPGSLALVDALAGAAVPVALGVVSSSRNARAVLDRAGLTARFAVVVDGLVAQAHGLEGKPAPATFRYAAGVLGVAPERCAVVEDAVQGVQAGRAGGFGLVVGVDRGAGPDALRAAGADAVVTDLAVLVPRTVP